jgi:trypanothione synthetase domain protein
MVRKVISYTLLGITLLGIASHRMVTHTNLNPTLKRGLPIDSFNGVYVYYNGGTSQSSGRNVIDGYNVGIRYQCVEFVKRYYYLHYHHHMPDTYGNAKDFFDKKLSSGSLNTARGLFQYKNRDQVRPQKGDLLVFDSYIFNPYGHVAIVSNVTDKNIEIIQQNPGPWGRSRTNIELERTGRNWLIKNNRILGWLRIEGIRHNNILRK